MKYQRHLVQYNELVFDSVDMISESVFNTSFKSFDEEYTFKHGAYSPHKGEYVLARPMSLSVTIHLFLRNIPCEYRDFYKQFAVTQLSRYGKLWSVENNTLEWAYAEMRGFNEVATVRKNKLEFDVDFYLPEGIWHKADKMKTFLVPYDRCSFMDCYDYQEIQPCYTGDCCHCGSETTKYCNCCDCNELTKEMALCYQAERGCCKDGLQMFYDCDVDHRIVYNCAAAEKFFGSYYGNEHMGERICSNECGPVAGRFYSDTELPTRGIKIKIHGKVTNPWININDNVNMIKGTFEELIIYPDMSIYEVGVNEIPLDVTDLVIPTGMEPGWTVYPGWNRIMVDGTCCDDVCVYVEADAITL